tara:strand:+ start:113 stop:376 length:264 start_codon:yes stop_codon:yes gene_type:complete
MDKNTNNLHLLANPYYHKKKEKKHSTIDKELLLLIQKKFPDYKISESDYQKNIKKIDTLFMETNTINIIEEYIEKIIQAVLNEQVLL